jgi:hypothetical protein
MTPKQDNRSKSRELSEEQLGGIMRNIRAEVRRWDQTRGLGELS